MSLLQKLNGKEDLGTIVDVQIVGYTNKTGQCIKEDSYENRYRVTLRNQKGESTTIEYFGRKPELGSQLKFQGSKESEKESDPWKQYAAYLNSLLTGDLLARIRYAKILDETVL